MSTFFIGALGLEKERLRGGNTFGVSNGSCSTESI